MFCSTLMHSRAVARPAYGRSQLILTAATKPPARQIVPPLTSYPAVRPAVVARGFRESPGEGLQIPCARRSARSRTARTDEKGLTVVRKVAADRDLR
jgi:hypothetical protein